MDTYHYNTYTIVVFGCRWIPIARNHQQLVLLSPGLDYAGVKTEQSIESFNKKPIFIAASPGDTYAYNSSQILYSKVKQNKNAVFQNGSASLHGVAMFNDSFDEQLLAWIEKHSQNKWKKKQLFLTLAR